METALILATVAACGGLMLLPAIRKSRVWRATITPLASIIGSGFLILGPILEVNFGGWAPAAMALLCLIAYAFGSAIRHNIRELDADDFARSRAEDMIELTASWALAFAYVISVAYYLNLFGSFAVSLTPFDNHFAARLVTSAMFLTILAVGWTKGFRALERLEQISVGAKLAIIAGLFTGLIWYFAAQTSAGALRSDPATLTGWPAITLLFGLIVTVQGFETSRYLGDEYDAPMRRRSMRVAQILSTVIYVAYIVLITYALHDDPPVLTETAIIGMLRVVSVILPTLLVVAALAAQFSAAVADTSGSGGLFYELTNGRLSHRMSYALLVGIGLVLTWFLDVFQIISWASRAFALYYGLQSALAGHAAWTGGHRPRGAFYWTLAVLGLAITIFGQPVE